MWHWHKTAAKEEESLWQERLILCSGAIFSSGFQASRIAIDVYAEEAEQVLVLQACYGGTLSREDDHDWVAATAPENIPPVRIRDQLVLCASADPEELDELRKLYPKRHVLSFPPEMAFGTGNHATTSTCLRLLCDYARKRRGEWTLIDIGCGTGVLALAGLRLGAKRAVSFDFDPQAVEIAKRNMMRNGGAEGLELFQADVFEWSPKPGQQADVVMANLFSTVLQRAFSRIRAAVKPSGILIISGILNNQAQETFAAAFDAGFHLQKSVSRGKWTTAQLTLS